MDVVPLVVNNDDAYPNCEITPIMPLDAWNHWSTVKPMLQRVLDRIDSGMLAEDVLFEIQQKNMQLWRVNDWQAMAITRIGVRPEWSALNIVYCSGEGADEWLQGLLDVLESFASDWGCKYVEMVGRPGWRKYSKACGYDPVAIVMRKEIDG
jgi:hypothetical protein